MGNGSPLAQGFALGSYPSPLQGLKINKNGPALGPRATPWADILCPFGALKLVKTGSVWFRSQGYALG